MLKLKHVNKNFATFLSMTKKIFTCFNDNMAFKESVKNILIKLGENNKPTYAVMAIAVAKGIARPLFTMSDKHADPETKKYTAIREALTEVVAIPTYYACGELAGKVAENLKFNNLPTEELRQYSRKNAKQNFMFLGVCTAALLVIPALASVTIKPFMKKIQENKKDINNAIQNSNKPIAVFNSNDSEKLNKSNLTFNSRQNNLKSYQSSIYAHGAGMEVGGL